MSHVIQILLKHTTRTAASTSRKTSQCLGGRQASETTTVKIKFHLRLIPFPTSAESHCYCGSQENLSQFFHCGN